MHGYIYTLTAAESETAAALLRETETRLKRRRTGTLRSPAACFEARRSVLTAVPRRFTDAAIIL